MIELAGRTANRLQGPCKWGYMLVLTSLTKQALPVLRYRTGDVTRLDPAPCRCGRTTVRMARIKGRTDDMLIIKGVNVFPSQLEAALLSLEDVAPHYQLLVD